jgi:uncharacterized protein
MYYRGDDSILETPKKISRDVLNKFITRVNENIENSKISAVTISLHGGEPLLVGKTLFKEICFRLTSEINANVFLQVQTNGILIDHEWIEIFSEGQVVVGLSLDGDKSAHDTYRIDHQGKGTYGRVLDALQLLQDAHRRGKLIFGGVLAVINLHHSPTDLYRHFVSELGIKNFNVLLPDCNHDTYSQYNSFKPESFGDFLISLYDEYAKDQYAVYIPMFQSIISLIFGGRSISESVGVMGNSIIVVNTDGGMGAHDVLRINDGYLENSQGMSVFNTSLAEIAKTPLFKIAGIIEFPEDSGVRCNTCPVYNICKGGFYGHRYSSERGYLNHNVFCDALFKIITHIYFDVAKLSAIDKIRLSKQIVPPEVLMQT